MPPNTVICGVTWMSALAPACVTMPGMSTAVAAHDRAVGTVVRISLSSVVWRRTLWTSTIGVSPVTVIVSWSAPTRSSALTAALSEPVSSIPSRR